MHFIRLKDPRVSAVRRLTLVTCGALISLSVIAPAVQASDRQAGSPRSSTTDSVTSAGGGYWQFRGHFYVENWNSNKCMGVAGGSQDNGAAVIQWGCAFKQFSDQDMLIRPVSDNPLEIWHTINPEHSINKCLGVAGSSQTWGTGLVQWTCAGIYDQQYALYQLSWGGFEIIVRHSGQCVGVAQSSMLDGAPIVQWPCSGILDQAWDLEYSGH